MKRVVLMTLLLSASGCGSGSGTMSGTVSYKGRPVTMGAVVVLNPDELTIAKGIIAADGTYSVSGVKPGLVKIGILSPDRAPGSKIKDPEWFQLPRPLGNPRTSGLECDVAAAGFAHDIQAK